MEWTPMEIVVLCVVYWGDTKVDSFEIYVKNSPGQAWGLTIVTPKTPNLKCRLYWCVLEFIDWRYSQWCWYFRPSFLKYCPSTFSLVHLPLFPVWISMSIQGASGIDARFLKWSPASTVRAIMTKFSQYTPHSTCYLVLVSICWQD